MAIDHKTKEPVVVLLVEDNIDHAELVKRSFEDHEIPSKLCHITDGEGALDYLYRRGKYSDPRLSPRPRIILLDLRLPKIAGLDVLKQLKEDKELQRIPVIVLTTSEGEEDYAKACEYHANSYLVKHLDYDKFTKIMEGLGNYWLDYNRPPW